MKTFENKEAEGITYREGGKPDGEKMNMGFADLALACLQVTPKEGWDQNSLKKTFKIESVLKKTEAIEGVLYVSELNLGDKIELEDAEFEYLFERALPKNMAWSIKEHGLLDFMVYMDELKNTKKE